MSVVVRIGIPEASPNDFRILEVTRIESAEPEPGSDPHDDVHTYRALYLAGDRCLAKTSFQHRYGAPLHVIIMEALEALDLDGMLDERNRPHIERGVVSP